MTIQEFEEMLEISPSIYIVANNVVSQLNNIFDRGSCSFETSMKIAECKFNLGVIVGWDFAISIGTYCSGSCDDSGWARGGCDVRKARAGVKLLMRVNSLNTLSGFHEWGHCVEWDGVIFGKRIVWEEICSVKAGH
jgi:hypothetical protein